MNDKISRVKLYVKDTFKAHDAEIIVKNELLNNGFIIDDNNYDMVISLGGDGTFLKMLHKTNFNSNIYYVSINAGSLGFLSSVEKDNIKKFISDLKNNLFNIRELDLLKIKVSSMEEIEYFSLNELTVRKTDFSSLRSDVYINNDLLENYIGDGLVVSTSIGSTGYNLALSGPVVDPSVKAYILSSIAPINNRVYHSLINPIVISNDKKITIIPSDNNNLCILTDGKIINIDNIKRIECSIINDAIKLIVPKEYNYINNIKAKLVD